MKFKPCNRGGGILVELSPDEVQLPPEPSELPTQPLPAFNLRRILVPIDFSECSKKALRYAVPFAKQFGAEVTLVHVIHYPTRIPEMIMADAQTMQTAERELRALLRKVSDDVPCQAVVRVGIPATEVVEAAMQSNTDLILLSTHGRSGLAHVILGSTAERIVRHAPCPVLVVREKEHEFVSDPPEASKNGHRALDGES